MGGKEKAGGRTASEAMLEKIRALIAKAEGTPFAAEADTFMAKARELMIRYHVTEEKLEAFAGKDGKGMGFKLHSFKGEAYGAKMWKRILFWSVPKLFGCKAYTSGAWAGTIVGAELDVEVAYDSYVSLRNRIVAAAKSDLAGAKARGIRVARGKELNYISTYCEFAAKAVSVRVNLIIATQAQEGLKGQALEKGDGVEGPVTPAQVNALMVVQESNAIDFAKEKLGVDLGKPLKTYARPWTPTHDMGAALRGQMYGERVSLGQKAVGDGK